MAIFPRWVDDFSTDPTSDPAYSVDPELIYNASLDQVEHDEVSVSVDASITLLNSNNSFGLAEFDFQYRQSGGNDNTFNEIRVFGYNFSTSVKLTNRRLYALPESTDLASLTTAEADDQAIFSRVISGSVDGFHTWTFISTPNGVDWFDENDLLITTLPPISVTADTRFRVSRSAGTFKPGENAVSRLVVKSDASLPLGSNITEPGLAGSVAGVDGPILVDIPESRLYLDLGAFAGQVTGLSNVVYDPGGSAVAMAEDSGVPDGSGGTVGDYYLEIPSREVASDYRLVIKEDFVTTNSVVVTDDIDFDVDGGPSTQNQLILEEDDLQCVIQKSNTFDFQEPYSTAATSFSSQSILDDRPANNLIQPNATNFSLHNLNADGNDTFISGKTPAAMLNDTYSGEVFYGTGFTYPILVDIDLGKVRNLTNITVGNTSGGSFTLFCDIYSNTVPFSGAGLGQGTLEFDNFPISAGGSINTDRMANIVAGAGSNFNFDTQFLRLAVNADNTGGATAIGLWVQIYLFGLGDFVSMDSVDDNAQFEHEPASGGGFVSFPVGGVTQQDGQTRIILNTELEVEEGSTTDFYRIFFKPDITD